MNAPVEPTTLGLSDHAHESLRRLKESGHFPEMQDAYRFAIALAARTCPDLRLVPEVRNPRTIFNVGTLDSGRQIRVLLSLVFGVPEGQIYKTAERLAEHGVSILAARMDAGTLSLPDLLAELDRNS